ncbi:MAG: ribosome maturation factor RimP [Pyrinomonadaceae bacterium]|nr:ribosome maturation factor RimP [Pyrinomonadaceae bacterium]
MGGSSIASRVEELATRACVEHGVELYHAEVAGPEGKPIIRIFIDKPEGVTHEDCSHVSHYLGTILEVEDFIHSPYTLEVSSPGLERGLYKLADYEKVVGHPAKLKSRTAINGQRNFRGRIIGVEGDKVVFEDVTSGRIQVPLSSIVKANLEIDVEAEFQRAKEREQAAKALDELTR